MAPLSLTYFNQQVAELKQKARVKRNEVMELAQMVDEAFQLGDLDGEVAFTLQNELFYLWPDK